MYKFSVGGNTYSVQFTYGTLYKTDLIDRVIKSAIPSTDDVDGFIAFTKNMIGMTAELLLVGLQEHHSDKFGFDTDEEREKRVIEICALLDKYEEEHADENGERTADGFTLYSELQAELEKNGFLSKMLALMGEPTESEEQPKTESEEQPKVPQDHKRKTSRGQSK